MSPEACEVVSCSQLATESVTDHSRGWPETRRMCHAHADQYRRQAPDSRILEKDPTLCIEPGCDRKRMGRGLCSMHYGRHLRAGDLDLVGLAPQNGWPARKKQDTRQRAAPLPVPSQEELRATARRESPEASVPPPMMTDAAVPEAEPTAPPMPTAPETKADAVEAFLLRCCGIVVGAEDALHAYTRRREISITERAALHEIGRTMKEAFQLFQSTTTLQPVIGRHAGA